MGDSQNDTDDGELKQHNNWFDALGEPVPNKRRVVARRKLPEMGLNMRTQVEIEYIDSVANKIEQDKPYEAIEAARYHLDLTGAYRLLAYLCVDQNGKGK